MSTIGQDIIKGLKEAVAYKKGDLTEKDGVKLHSYNIPSPGEINVKEIRENLGMTQEEFTCFGFSLSAIRHWEQKQRTPVGSSRILLKIIEINPQEVLSITSNSGKIFDNSHP